MSPLENPFKPPAANVDRQTVRTPAPPEIKLAVRLFWITLALSLLSLVPGYRTGYWDELVQTPLEITFGIMAVFLGLYCLLVIYIGKGANWARWVMLLLTVLSWLDTLSNFSSLLSQGFLAVVTDLAVMVGEVYALKCLFLGEGAQWFRGAD